MRSWLFATAIFLAGIVCSSPARSGDGEQKIAEPSGAEFCLELLPWALDGDETTFLSWSAQATLRSLWNDEVKLALIESLQHPHADWRRLAADGLGAFCAKKDRKAHEGLVQVLGENDPKVLRSIYLAMGQIDAPEAADILATALSFDEGKDKDARLGLVQAIDATGPSGVQKLLALADSGSDRDLDKVLEVYPTLRSRAAAEHLIALVKNYHVAPQQKAKLIQSYATYPTTPALSMQPLTDYLATLPAFKKNASPKETKLQGELVQVRLAALEVLAMRAKVDQEMLRDTLLGIVELGDSERLAELAAPKGDAKRGKKVFLHSKSVDCAACHRLQDVGGKGGPDLTPLLPERTAAKILETIVTPGNKPKEAYHDVAKHLSLQQIYDLLSFLSDRRTQESLRGVPLEFLVVGPFDGKIDAEHGPMKDADPALRYERKTGQISIGEDGLTWRMARVGPDEFVNLAPTFADPKISVYAMTRVYSPAPQQACLEVGGSAVARYWINGKRALDFAPCCGAEPTAMTLDKGWNLILVRVFATQGELSFSLRISGAEGIHLAPRKD